MSDDQPPRGYAGLIHLASSDAIPPRPTRPAVVAAASAAPKVASNQMPPRRAAKVASPKLDKRGSGRALAIWAGLIATLIVSMIILVRCSSSDTAPDEPSSATTETADAPAPAPVPIEPVAAPLAESIPSVGTGLVLSRDEIRYCLSQHIRLDTWAGQVNKDSHTAVTAFNAGIDDYNSRCSRYKYRQGALESVRAEVEDNRSALVGEGMQLAAEHR